MIILALIALAVCLLIVGAEIFLVIGIPAVLAKHIFHPNMPDLIIGQRVVGGVEVVTSDGRSLRHHEPVNRGAGERALSAEEISAKFLQNALLAVSRSRADEIRAAVLSVDKMSARDFARCLCG